METTLLCSASIALFYLTVRGPACHQIQWVSHQKRRCINGNVTTLLLHVNNHRRVDPREDML